MKLSVLIPVYNEEATVEEVIKRVMAVDLGEIEKEIIVTDDGSTDGSWEVLKKISEQNQRIFLYRSMINLGKGAAIRLSLKNATGDIILIQDADLELDPKEYLSIIEPILKGEAEVVYGSRFLSKKKGISKRTRWANKFLVLLTNVIYRGHLTDMETAYKAFKSPVIKKIRLSCVRFDFEPEVTAKVLKAGYRIHEVPISYHPRTINEGKKIGREDGLDAIYTLLKYRFFD